jgi:hypothetical protein
MYSGNLINDLIAMVERAEARCDGNREPKLASWGALIAQGAPGYELVNPKLAGVA